MMGLDSLTIVDAGCRSPSASLTGRLSVVFSQGRSSVQTYKFLGVIFDPKMKWTPQAERAAGSADAWTNLVQCLARTSTSISAKGMHQLYTAIAIPKMAYAADVWYTLPHFPNPASKKRSGLVKFTKQLTATQQHMTISMLGAMRTMAGDVLNAHAFLPPPHLLFLKALTRSATHLATLPDNHPLARPAQQAIKKPIKRHRSPLHTLFATTGVKPRNYETILTARRRHNYNMRVYAFIEEDRAKAVEEALEPSGTFIYTDGSGYEHGIGAAAILIEDGNVKKTLCYWLGPDTDHTVYEAEAVAVILALHLAYQYGKRLDKISIGLDNQAVLLGLLNQRSKPSHYLLDAIHDSLEDFQVAQARIRGKRIKGYRKGKGRARIKDGSLGWREWKLKMRCEVEFTWTPGHKGITGNEKADTEAKRAATGESSPRAKLPTILRGKPLPISISVTRQSLKKQMKLRWKGEWSLSPCYTRTAEIDSLIPSKEYIDIIEQLRRNQVSLLTQLRTGHVPLNQILFRIKRSDSPFCPHCGNGFHESIFHFPLTCPHYTEARRQLITELGRDTFSIPFLLGTRTGIPPLLRYINKTGRLKTIFGEVRPDDDFEFKVIKQKRSKHLESNNQN